MVEFLMLLGDSTPRDNHIRANLERRLAAPLRQPEAAPLPLEERIAGLERLLEDEADKRFVLIGRSSGARVVTKVAANPAYSPRIAAVVALGYPFRHPARGLEPERYIHLHLLRAPCLIVQGTEDNYGGRDVVASYALPDRICVQFVETNHQLELPPGEWDAIGASIRRFVSGVLEAPSWRPAA